MNWLILPDENCINLENLASIWVYEGDNGFFLKGEMIHNSEEVVLSANFTSEKECRNYMYKFLSNGVGSTKL